MKITTFNPLVVSDKADEIVALFDELGFELRHAPMVDEETAADQDFRLKDANGFYVDVAQYTGIPQDMTMIRMNVSDFDEVYETLTKRGFKNTRGDGTVNTATSKAATMVAPSGMTIALVEHLK